MKARRWTVDLPPGVDPPAPGDLLVSPQLVYTVAAVEPVDSWQWENRWRVTVQRVRRRSERERREGGWDRLLGPNLSPDRRWWPVTPYRKGEPRPWEKLSSDT